MTTAERIMYPEEAVQIARALLDYEGQNDRFDADTIQALEVLIEIAEDYYTAAVSDE